MYALGLVGYAMLTGRPPFDGGSVQEILTQQLTREPPSLRKLFPELESRIAALGPARADEADGQREMRQLYSSQLELLKRLSRQSHELSERRARYVDLLRTLWRQMNALRADHTVEDIRLHDLTARIRQIAESIGDQLRGRDNLPGVSRGVLGGMKQ
jgi:serine/threonine protein kinase